MTSPRCRATWPGFRTSVRPPDVSTSPSISVGKKALASAASAIKWADGQGSSINNQAQALATTAKNYANNHLCD
jgi:hypothetical protein